MRLTKQRITYVCEMLGYCRPHGSATEQAFIDRYLLAHPLAVDDDFGNVHVDLRNDPSNTTLFVAHTDTVHRTEGAQRVRYDAKRQTISTLGECLGADDAAGILVLLHMIENKVPAYYIFTRGEEKGGLGAKYLTRTLGPFLAQFDRAVAFDRKGTSSVITHMYAGRTCSDNFADALCDALGNDFLMYAPDPTGSYTDTCEFMDLIPECTNISAGYAREHGPNETLDLLHLFDLMDQVLVIDWDRLPVDRDPLELEAIDYRDHWTTWADDWATDRTTGISTPVHRLGAKV